MAIYRLGEHAPQVSATAWVADNVSVIGRVELADGVSIWYGSTLRGDNESMRVCRSCRLSLAVLMARVTMRCVVAV